MDGMTDYDALRELTAAATPGPWEWATDEGAPVYVQIYCADEGVTEYEADVLSSDERGVLISEANAALIAAMRNALPDLLAENARLSEVVEAARHLPLAVDTFTRLERRDVDTFARLHAALAKLDGADGPQT